MITSTSPLPLHLLSATTVTCVRACSRQQMQEGTPTGANRQAMLELTTMNPMTPSSSRRMAIMTASMGASSSTGNQLDTRVLSDYAHTVSWPSLVLLHYPPIACCPSIANQPSTAYLPSIATLPSLPPASASSSLDTLSFHAQLQDTCLTTVCAFYFLSLSPEPSHSPPLQSPPRTAGTPARSCSTVRLCSLWPTSPSKGRP